MREDYLTGDKEHMTPAERDIDKALRPLSFSDFTGQAKVVENLKIFVMAARRRGEPSGSRSSGGAYKGRPTQAERAEGWFRP